MEDVSGETKQSSPDTFFCTFCICIFMRLAVFRGRMFPIRLYCLMIFNTRAGYCFTGVWNGKKYKAYILKYKALILKYVPYLFYKMPYLFLHDGKHSFFSPLFLHFLHENLNLNTKLSLAQLFVLPFMLSL